MKKIGPVQVEPVYKAIPQARPALYRARRAGAFVDDRLALDPTAEPWADLPVAAVSEFHPASRPGPRPRTDVRLLHARDRLRALFDVEDHFVRCVHDEYQSMVSRDSCVEMFLQPPGGSGYFNFEFSCGGAMLLYYIEDPARHPDRIFSKFTPVPPDLGGQVVVASTLLPPIDPEIAGPVRWQLACEVPVRVLAPFVPGGLDRFAGPWRGNFFKCGDDTSHPHWAAWSSIGPVCRFHQPERFGTIVFED